MTTPKYVGTRKGKDNWRKNRRTEENDNERLRYLRVRKKFVEVKEQRRERA